MKKQFEFGLSRITVNVRARKAARMARRLISVAGCRAKAFKKKPEQTVWSVAGSWR